jgi:hypothetical protein
MEHNIKIIAHKYDPTNPELFYTRLAGVGIVAAIHDETWHGIFKSQLLMLNEVNRRGGVLALADAKRFYDRAVPTCPNVYPAYKFENWLKFMVTNQLLVHHPTDMLEMTYKAKDLLKYLAHWGRDANMRAC